MIKVSRIRMDYLEAPEGVEEIPEFGWILESDQKNVVQNAYELEIAKDPDFEELIYAGGQIESPESAHIAIGRNNLREWNSCTAYYARVKVWANTEESTWSAPVRLLTGLVNREWKGEFVSAETKADKTNSKGTYLRKSFSVEKEVKSAVICSTALGLYHLYLNGERVGCDELAPGWTSYHHQVMVQTYDVTHLLCRGENVIGAHVGAGWYKGMMGFIHERNNYGDQTALLLQMSVRYADNTEETIVTDESWLGCNSPVTFSEIYGGERYDARLEQPGWNAPGFIPEMDPDFHYLTKEEKAALIRDPMTNPFTDEEKEAQNTAAENYVPENTLWHAAETVPFSKEILAAQPGCRVRIETELPAQKLFVTPKGERVLDFGQNLAGWVRFRVRGKEGELAHIRCFESLDSKGNAYFDNLRYAKAEVRYICSGKGEETFSENFSFQGFRYAKLESWPEDASEKDFSACAVHSEMEETGHFVCSNPLVNQLEHNIEWSLRGNFVDIPTDCPQRDERMGWTGDAQIFCRTASFLRNTYPFFSKWLKDVAFDQTPEGGVPHIVPNSLQFYRITDWLLGQGTHSAAAWADVAVINPWTLYLTYGDKRILKQQFESMKKWIDFMRDHAVDYIWNYKLQFGDWVALDAEEGSYFGATPNDLTCTAYFAYSTGLFVKICRVLEKESLARSYEELYDKIVLKFQKTFFGPDGSMTVQTQTAHIVALYFHLVPEGAEKTVTEELKELLKKENGHLVTGFVGTPYFCHALSQNGCVKEAYDLLLKEDFPSWLYEVKAGATTIWEHWDGLKPDGSMWSADMNSFNHYAYGAIGEWLYRVSAGLEIDESAPGYRRSIIAPKTSERFDWAEGSFESVYGRVSDRWERKKDIVSLTVTVPTNTTAEIVLEKGASDPVWQDGETARFVEKNGGLCTTVGSGTYHLSYRIL